MILVENKETVKPSLQCFLLVDDDVSVNFLHQRLIRSAGFEQYIHTTSSAESALQFLSYDNVFDSGNELPRPGLILLDITLPRMNAWEFLNEYRKLPKEILDNSKVVIVTSSNDPKQEKIASEYPEVIEYLKKPITVEILNSIVNKYFA